MRFNRREFMLFSAAVAAGCAANKPVRLDASHIDAGPESQYSSDGVYSQFRERGFFVVRQNGKLLALSSICTHMGCKVKNLPDGNFKCPCHGSGYGPDGQVIHGPAVRPLPLLPSEIDSNGHLIVEAVDSRDV